MLLSLEKPRKVRSTEEHNQQYQSDTEIAGTYVPNMSVEDQLRWKGKHIKGKDPRVEIRKVMRLAGGHAQVLIVVRWPVGHDDVAVTLSTNGKMLMTLDDWADLGKVVHEACQLLQEKQP